MVTVSKANIDAVKGMPDVEFDFGVSAALKAAFGAEATRLSGQRGPRAAARTTGLDDFRGHFSEVFRTNGVTQLNDLDEIVTNLRLVVTEVDKLEQAARAENARRKTAREWAQRQADRSGLEKWWDDHVSGSEDPPAVTLSDTGPTASVPQPPHGARQAPPPGSGGGGGGTSSARPTDLRSFATTTAQQDTELSGSAPRLDGQCSDFDASCRWATLDATGPVQGLREWLRQNGDDRTWATIVADAFRRAGSDGSVNTLSNATVEAALRAAGVSENRRDLDIDPPTAYGSPPTTGYSDDPVNTASGNFTETEVDLDLSGAATLQLTRTYNSLDRTVRAFGPGWSSWTDVRLEVGQDGARLHLPDGRAIVFPRLGAGWDRAAGENLWLTAGADGDHVVTGSSGLRWVLDADGRLLETSSGPGTRVSVDHDARGRLVGLTHERGRHVRLEWDDASSRVVAARAGDGREVRYDYDADGRLVAARRPDGDRRYRWDEAGLVAAVVDADGVVEVDNRYDESGRVVAQRSPFGRTTRYVYVPGGVTEVSDADGERSNTWICDAHGRLIGAVDADGHRQSSSYDRHGNPVMVTQRDGSAVLSLYDERGRRVRQVTPTGADLTWTWDEADRPVEVSATADGTTSVTRLRYDGDSRNPAEVVDPEGGVTTMTWRDGLLTEVVDPEGVTLRFAYDERGDLVSSTDADGAVARLERDELGRVVAAVTPLGHRTTYRYDGFRPLLSRQDPTGGIWRYEHTPAGRLRAVVDPTGGRTEIEHGAHGLSERTVDPLGRAVGSAYDDLGNRRRVELPDGTAWGFDHDALSRLVAATDPTGATWRLGHDVQGDLVETRDPTGLRRTVERDAAGRPVRVAEPAAQTTATYDALGRMLTEAGPDGAVHRYRYDRCGRVVEHTDPAGGTTRVRYDRAGRPVAVTHPAGSTFSYSYDACGRRVATTDTDGSRYAFAHDADGRLVREDWPTGEQAWARYDAAGRVVERHEPGRGTARFAYDAAGRVVRATDAWSGQRRFRYDAAGQLVAATDALGAVTTFEHDLGGRCVAVVDPLGGRRERSFDALGRVVAETDPLGRTARYAYDAAGRQVRQVDPSGSVRSWVHDRAGRLAQSYADDTLLSSVEWDETARTLQVHDGDLVHELTFDTGGRLLRKRRGDVSLSWSYDADGRRTAFTGPDGEQTRYEYDAAGRVSALETPGLGRAVLDRDAIGRVVALAAPGLHTVWTWERGAVARLEVRREGTTQVTEIERDEAGRVVAETVDGARTAYAYDPAGQLVEVRRGDGSATTYTYDAGGRLVREVSDGEATRYVYDVAGQLLAQRGAAGGREYRYDTLGRRVQEDGPEGGRRFAWDERGYLRSVTSLTHAHDKVTARTHRMRVDAFGELADVDGAAVLWDSAAAVPALAQVGDLSVNGFGPLTGLLPEGAEEQGRWVAPGARPRPVGSDPWEVADGHGAPGLPAQVSVADQGSLLIGGLEWMQARVYDPGSRGFLSTDPLDPAPGATGWGNPYAFAGNDPRNASDPWGLAPLSDADLQAIRDSNNGSLRNAASAATSWVKDNWEYIAAGALIVGGVAVMCTGIGGPIGAAMIGGALMSAGTSAGMQKFQNGSVDWGQVALDGAIGGVAGLAGGGAGVAAARGLARSSMNCLGRNMLTGAAAGAADGGVSGGLSYATSGQPVTAAGLARATLGGAGLGGAGGAVTAGALTKISGSACFVAGTQVLMGDGTARSIEDLVVGDEVRAADPDNDEVVARRVVDTYVTPGVETYEVETSGGTVVSTAEHPFWVDGKGWVPVRALVAGDKLVDAEGVRVELLSVTATGQTATVYNVHVEGLNSYHVLAGDRWVRVHNKCTSQILANKANGDAASDAIAARYPGAQREVTLQAPSGTRRVDVLTPVQEAIESKVGRTSLTRAARLQIQKDVELMNDPTSGVSSATWEFGPSPVTGRSGPTQPLEDALRAAGITIR